MYNELVRKIISTVVYYDVMDYPMTGFEIWKYLIKINGEVGGRTEYCLEEVLLELENPKLRRYVGENKGFYYLRGKVSGNKAALEKSALVDERLIRNKVSVAKLKRIKWVIWILRFVPFVRMIGITGRLAMKNAQSDSDWDLFIALKKGRIWTGRTLITLLTQVIGKRRYGNKVKDRVCLNYYVTDKSLEIFIKDIFSAHEYFFMLPVLGAQTFYKFRLANHWIKNIKVNYFADCIMSSYYTVDSIISDIFRNIGEAVFEIVNLENWLKKVEKDIIKKNPKTHQAGSYIEATDEALIFLPNPQGPKIFEKYQQKMNEL